MAIRIERYESSPSGSDPEYKIFDFPVGSVFAASDRHTSGAFEISAPNANAEQTTTINLIGLKRVITLSFRLFDSATDLAVGTADSGTVMTKEEQYAFLKQEFISGLARIQYRITVNDEIVEIQVAIADFSLDTLQQNPDYFSGQCTFIVGNNSLASVNSI